MRARTKRLKSLLVGIVSVLWSGHGSHAPQQRRPRRRKGCLDADPGVRPPLPHEGPCWGRAAEVGRGSPPAPPACVIRARLARPRAGPTWSRVRAAATRVPILIIATDKPTPEQRVAALRAGAWDFVRHPGDPEEVALKLQTYVQAKRNIDVAFAEGLIDPATGLHSRPGLARRARELGALMARTHGALARVVVMLAADAPAPPA